jgi:SOS-response transcriptional repressor LexA
VRATPHRLRVQGESMIDAGIYPGDVLVVDRFQQGSWSIFLFEL